MDDSRSIVKQSLIATIAVIAIAGAGYAGYHWFANRAPEPAPAPPSPPTAAPAAPAAAVAKPAGGPQYPIDERDSDHDTPLDQSDARFLEALAGVQGWRASALRMLVPEHLIRHIVATTDALTRDKLPLAVMPTRSVPGPFRASGPAEHASIADTNARRYEAIVGLATGLDTAQLAGVYRRFYPLFQQAYRELGYPKGYFNDRLVEVIDELLDAPDPKPPIAVAAPSAMYHYVDPDLEALPSGQKILVRVGSANEAALKTKLRALRKAITTPG